MKRHTLTVSGSWKCWEVPLSTIPATLSRWSRAISCAIVPPIEYPTKMAGPQPSSRTTAAASPAQSVSRNGVRARRPRPWPRWSMASTR